MNPISKAETTDSAVPSTGGGESALVSVESNPGFRMEDIPALFADPEFANAPHPERSQMLEAALGSAYQEAAKDGVSQEDHVAFGDFANQWRQKNAEGWGEWAGRNAKELGTALVDMGKSAGAAVAVATPGVQPLYDVGLQQPGAGVDMLKTMGNAAGYALDDRMSSYAQAASAHLTPAGRKLQAGVDDLFGRIDRGEMPFDSAESRAAWVKGEAAKLLPLQPQASHALDQPENVQLLASYMATRNPEAKKQLEANLLETQARSASKATGQELLNSPGSQHFERVFGKGSARHLVAGADPVMAAMAALPFLRGLGVIGELGGAEASALSKAAAFTGEQSAFGVDSALREDPNHPDVAGHIGKMLALGGVMRAGGMVVGRLTGQHGGAEAQRGGEGETSRTAEQQSSGAAEVIPPGAGILQQLHEHAAVSTPSTTEKSGTGTRAELEKQPAPSLPAEFKGALDHGIELVRNGIKDFAAWSVEMIKKFGDAIRDYLKDVWAAATKTSETGAVQLGGTVEKAAGDETAGGGTVKAGNASGLPPGERAPSEGDVTETRSFGERVAEDPRMNPRVQAQAAQAYVPIENVETLAQANAIIDQLGLGEASRVVRDAATPMPPHVRVALGMQVMLRLDQEARALRNAGDLAGAGALWQQTGEIGNFVDGLGTQAGRAVQAFAMWTRLTPEGILTTFEKKVREVNKGEMPALPPELLGKLGDLRDRINATPENSPLRADMMRELMSELALYQGIPITSVFTALWYANLLSGITTQGMNVVGNGWYLMLRTLASGFANHPRDTWHMLRGLLNGLGPAFAEMRSALKGKVDSRNAQDSPTVDAMLKRNALDIMLDRPPSDWKGWTAWVLSAGGLLKYVGRALNAMDAGFYYTAAEGRAHLAASRAARQGFKAGTPEYVQAMAAMLGRGEGAWDAAMNEAERQLKAARKPVTMADKKRIAYQIMRESRPAEIREEAGRFGELVTSQQEPDGMARVLSQLITAIQRFPGGRVFVPFNRTLVNLMSNMADFSPVGVVRAAKGSHLWHPQEEFSQWERRERAVAGIMGTTVMAAVWALANGHKDEDDETVPFMIYGMGPKSEARRAQMPKGWKPYTFKVGNKYIPWSETPLALALAPVAAIMDAQRYEKSLSDQSAEKRAQYYAQAVLRGSTSVGVLSSAADFFGVMTGDTPLSKLPSRVTSGMIPAQGLLRDVTGLFDPVKISDDTVAASILRDVPVLRNMAGRPALDYMGDPITYEGLSRIPVVKRFVADQRTNDRDKTWVGQMRLTIPGFQKSIEVGSYLTKNEKASAKMARVDAGMLTPDEQYAFAKRAGQLTREAVKQMRLNYEESRSRGLGLPDREQLQKHLDMRVRAARMLAMREVMMK